jgi:hypothetical protein
MGVLALLGAAAVALLAGCYSPSLRDCTVACAEPADCAPAQVCGPDGMCASPEMAGRCAMEADAAPMPEPDAGVPDAAPDAALLVKLRVQIDGRGSVQIDGRGTCSSADPSHGNCMYDLPLGVAQRVQAVAIDPDQTFAAWASFVCGGEGPVCTFTPLVATAVVAKFSHSK